MICDVLSQEVAENNSEDTEEWTPHRSQFYAAISSRCPCHFTPQETHVVVKDNCVDAAQRASHAY